MKELEERVHAVLPTTPPRAVIFAFQFGASVPDVLRLAGLSGAALARAKLYLPQIRRDAIRSETHANSEILTSIQEVLAAAVPTSVAEQGIQKFALLRPQLQENKRAIADLQLDVYAAVSRLKRINEGITRTATSSTMGRRSLRNLAVEHNKCTASISRNFQQLLKLADERAHILAETTKFIDSVLVVAGCNISGVHSAGGSNRTLRTVYNRSGGLSKLQPGQFPDEMVTACMQLLKRLAQYEEAVIDLRRSVKADLELLGGKPGTIHLPRTNSPKHGWADSHWRDSTPALTTS
jgi:hypothetical protein